MVTGIVVEILVKLDKSVTDDSVINAKENIESYIVKGELSHELTISFDDDNRFMQISGLNLKEMVLAKKYAIEELEEFF